MFFGGNPYYTTNPLEPRTPEAPPWDSKATANGVYVSDDFNRAADYGFMIGELTESKPVVVEIESTGLTRHPDPQAIDLLSEPYDYYRQDLLNYVRDIYVEKLLNLRAEGVAVEARRSILGTFRDFAYQEITKPNVYFRPARIQYTIGNQEKVDAAGAIFPQDYTWAPLQLFHEYYGSEASNQIWKWLDWRPDLDENPHSSQSLFCPLGSKIPTPILNLASNMFYFDLPIGRDRITRAWFLTENGKTEFINQGRGQAPVFHGTSLSRFNQAFQSSYLRNPKKLAPLLQVVQTTLAQWITEDSIQYAGHNEWLRGIEGQIYVRYTPRMPDRGSQLDLAYFNFKKKYRQQGLARQIVEIACQLPINWVVIENIQNLEWGQKVRNYQFPGRKTITQEFYQGRMLTVSFVKEA